MNKYEGKLFYIADDTWNSRKNRYIFIYQAVYINNYLVKYINLAGQEDSLAKSKYWMAKYLEEIRHEKHWIYETLIKNIFETKHN